MKWGRWLAVGLWGLGLGLAFLAGTRSGSEMTQSAPDQGREHGSRVASAGPGGALRLGDPSVSAEAFNRSILRLEKSEEFQALFEESLSDRENMNVHDGLFLLADAWAAKVPEQAADWLDALELNDSRNPYLFSALGQWASKDPQAAMDWLSKHHEEGVERDYLMAGLIRGAAMTDPTVALKALLALPNGPEKRGSVEFVTRAWLNEGADFAVENLAAIPSAESSVRERAIEQIIAHSDLTDQEWLRSWATGISNRNEARIATAAVAARWSQSDASAAAKWVGDLSDGESRALAYGEVGARWARADPLEAGKWLGGNAGSSEYDLAARGVAWSTVGIDPDLAFLQVSGIKNEALRDETFEQLSRIWMSGQPQLAKQYFEGESPIPSELRERLLEAYE